MPRTYSIKSSEDTHGMLWFSLAILVKHLVFKDRDPTTV